MQQKLKIIFVFLITLLLSNAGLTGKAAADLTTGEEGQCFYKSEETSNRNKICYYDCTGSKAAITIGALENCPQTITR